MGAKLVERYKALCAIVIDVGAGHTRSRLSRSKQLWSVVLSQAWGWPCPHPWHGHQPGWAAGAVALHLLLGAGCLPSGGDSASHRCPCLSTTKQEVSELFLESFRVLAMLVLTRSGLITYFHGCTSSVVVGSGASISCMVGVWEGYVLSHTTSHLHIVTSLDAFQGAWVPWDTHREGGPPSCTPAAADPNKEPRVAIGGCSPFFSTTPPRQPPKRRDGFIWPRCQADACNYR